MGEKWTATLRIIDIINKLKTFIDDYLKQLSEGTLVLIGSYYLGAKYDLSVLESPSICKNNP
jgi:hypothetical protein